MSKVISILFVFFSAITGSFSAMMLSRFFIPKSNGLAGGAEVLGYGIFGLIAGLVLALLLKNRMKLGTLKLATLVLALGSIAAVFWVGIKVNADKTPVDIPHTPKQETAAPDRM